MNKEQLIEQFVKLAAEQNCVTISKIVSKTRNVKSWNYLIPAIRIWEDIDLKDLSAANKKTYISLCNYMDDAICSYHLETAFVHFYHCIKWYYSLSTLQKPKLNFYE